MDPLPRSGASPSVSAQPWTAARKTKYVTGALAVAGVAVTVFLAVAAFKGVPGMDALHATSLGYGLLGGTAGATALLGAMWFGARRVNNFQERRRLLRESAVQPGLVQPAAPARQPIRLQGDVLNRFRQNAREHARQAKELNNLSDADYRGLIKRINTADTDQALTAIEVEIARANLNPVLGRTPMFDPNTLANLESETAAFRNKDAGGK